MRLREVRFKACQSAMPCIFCHVRRCLPCSLHRAARPEYLRSCQQVGKARSVQRAVRPEAAGVQAAVARGGECFRMPWKARHTRARTRECEAWESASKRVKKAANNLARCLPPHTSESRIDNSSLQEKLKSQEDGCARGEILAKLCTSFCHTATAYQHEVCSRSSTHSSRMNIRMNACVRKFATFARICVRNERMDESRPITSTLLMMPAQRHTMRCRSFAKSCRGAFLLPSRRSIS